MGLKFLLPFTPVVRFSFHTIFCWRSIVTKKLCGVVLLATVTSPAPSVHAGEIYVSSFLDGAIWKVDTNAPATPILFAAAVPGVSNTMSTLVYGPDGNFYAGSEANNKVLKYNGSTGAYMGIVADSASGLGGPLGLAFGPDSNLYVSSAGTGAILRYSTAGTFLGRFDVPGAPITPGNLTFGPDGHLYVIDALAPQIRRYNGITGESMGTFATRPGSPYSSIGALAFGSEGDLYATTNSNNYGRFDGTTGAFEGTFFNPAAAFFHSLDALFFDDKFYAANMAFELPGYGGIYTFDAATGASLGRLITDSNFQPGALAVVPEPASIVMLAAGSVLLMKRRRARRQ
jgi:hypothetical protein